VILAIGLERTQARIDEVAVLGGDPAAGKQQGKDEKSGLASHAGRRS